MAPSLMKDLLSLDYEESMSAISREKRFHSLALCEAILASSRRTNFEDPKGGLQRAELGLQIAKSLDPETYGAHVVRDLCGRSWTELANSYRVNSDFASAERCLTKAHACLHDSYDPLEKARFLDISAVLKKDQRQFEEALRLRERAISIHRSLGETHLLCLSLCSKGSDLLEMGEPEAATQTLHEAVKLLDSIADPHVSLAAYHNLATALVLQGRYLEAANAFSKFQHLYREDLWSQARQQWLRGRIAMGLGHLKEAESAFLTAREEFRSHDVPYDFALVSIELALVYARQGHTRQVRKLATEMVPIFKSRNIHREALAALTLFRQAAEREAATEGTLQEIFERLQKAPRKA